jgi:hypothetical protein
MGKNGGQFFSSIGTPAAPSKKMGYQTPSWHNWYSKWQAAASKTQRTIFQPILPPLDILEQRQNNLRETEMKQPRIQKRKAEQNPTASRRFRSDSHDESSLALLFESCTPRERPRKSAN